MDERLQRPADCTSFVTVASGRRHVPDFDEWYSSPNPAHFTLVATFPDRYHMDESVLQPGDALTFVGHPYIEDLGIEVINGVKLHKQFVHYGKHAIAYIRPHVYTDSDTRRPGVAQYDLRDKPATDDWFSGPVRVLRWKDGVQ